MGHGMNRRDWLRLLGAACATCVLPLWSATATAQWTDSTLWGVDGNVDAVTRSGSTLYVGGSFNTVGPNSGGGVLLERQTGDPVPYPRVAGTVRAVVPDGGGGWFIGGNFAGVGGMRRHNLAHILPGGVVAPWDPNVDGLVLALALNGRQLYVGGSFAAVGGIARANFAAIDVVTGQVLNWRADTDAAVYALAVGAGGLYVGGDFSMIGGVARNSVAAIDPVVGTVESWNPDVGFEGTPGRIRALAVAGDTVYVGGDFVSVGTQVRHRIASIDAVSGVAMNWDLDVEAPLDEIYGDPYVFALAIRGSSIYVGGRFQQIGGVDRRGFAEVDRVSATVSDWNPVPTEEITGLAVRDSSLFLCGGFTTIAGQSRRFCAELNLRTGLPTAFAPRPDEPVKALAASVTGVYVGGAFFSVGQQWRTRRGLAAFDLTTGAVKDWDPNPDGLFTQALIATHGKLYVGGYFSTIGGQTRYGLAAFDTSTGMVTDWNPTANSVVGCFAVAGDTLYVGGYFSTMGGQPRGRLASFDLNTGALTSWNPNADPDVYGLTVSGGTVYVSGFFWRIGGYARKGLAAVDAVSGAILPWDPQSDKWCYATAVEGDTIFVAGYFNTLGGQPRRNLAAVDRTTGQALAWVADADNAVEAFALINDTLFVGGAFTTIGGERRSSLAALDARTGSVQSWSPDLGLTAWDLPTARVGLGALALAGNTLYFGGGFGSVGLVPASCVAAVSFGPPPVAPTPPSSTLAMAPLEPNPVRTSATIRFALPTSGLVSLTVYDLQGRRVASLLSHAARPAGLNQISMPADGWRAGIYFCRLEAAGAIATRKFAILR